jgi:hypothetical protein
MIQENLFSSEELLEIQKMVRGFHYFKISGDPGQFLYLARMPPWVIERITLKGYISKQAFARLNTEDLDYKFRIHSDAKSRDDLGDWFYPDMACVFYPFDTPGHGTGMFRHNTQGDHCNDNIGKAFTYDDGNWVMYDYYEGKANTALFYESNKYHCRYPFKAFGKTAEDGRIVIVNFMVKSNDSEQSG